MNGLTIEFESLRETYDIECKAAQGRDGMGELPKDFWESYSAMANTDGGSIYLGVQERDNKFTCLGIKRPEKVIKDLTDTANNTNKVSVNLINNSDIIQHEVDGGIVIEVRVRRASRKDRPVYLKRTPIGNSYQRRHEADQRMSEDAVKRMLADQQYDSLDSRILKGYELDDLNQESLRSFQRSVATRSPETNFETLSQLDFLKQVGGWKKDRETGVEGLTVAGLLMFGNYQSIRDEFTHYFLDYQQRPESKTEQRYTDRICPDGTWSGNLYDFYRKVYPKLVSDLKLGFQLKDGIREGENPAHIAIREAFVNAIVHADYTVSTSLLVVKRPDFLGFKNPGKMRIPLSVAIEGGESDSRNKSIQDMFRMIGAGERQGFGIRKIIQNWKEFDWRLPHFEESDDPSPHVRVRLSMLSLFPEQAVKYFKLFDKGNWRDSTILEKTALILAYTERAVSHSRLSQFSDKHTKDISDCLQNLEKQGKLTSTGAYRAKIYHLPYQSAPSPEDVFDSETLALSSTNLAPSSTNLAPSSTNLALSSTNLTPSSTDLDEKGRVIHCDFNFPLVDDLTNLHPEYLEELEYLAKSARENGKIPQTEMFEIILTLCTDQYLTANALSHLVNRKIQTLRGQYINKLKSEGNLLLAFPRTPSDPRQAYITNKDSHD